MKCSSWLEKPSLIQRSAFMQNQSTTDYVPTSDQETPSQNIMKEDESSPVLSTQFINDQDSTEFIAYRPAAKILDELPLLTSTAVTGPGIIVGSPMAVQVSLVKLYWATFAEVPSGNEMAPAATRSSWLL